MTLRSLIYLLLVAQVCSSAVDNAWLEGMMFTDGGSGDVDYTTPAAVVGCQDLNGRWTSKQTTERMDLNHNEDDSLEGLYNACANCGWLGVQGRKATAQFTLGLTMVGQGGDLVTSWAGQCYMCNGEEVLHFHKLGYDIDQGEEVACNHDWSFPSSEESVYYRD